MTTQLHQQTANYRIYAQLRPEGDSLVHLAGLQLALPEQDRGRLVPSRQLHMTLIHFGKVQDIFETITRYSEITYDDYISLLVQYVVATDSLIPDKTFTARPVGFARFGQRGGTLAVQYEVSDELVTTHAKLVHILKNFLQMVGIPDVDAFMAADLNFMHAVHALKPHITLYKGYKGPLPDLPLEPIQLRPTPTLYPPK